MDGVRRSSVSGQCPHGQCCVHGHTAVGYMTLVGFVPEGPLDLTPSWRVLTVFVLVEPRVGGGGVGAVHPAGVHGPEAGTWGMWSCGAEEVCPEVTGHVCVCAPPRTHSS